VASLPTISGVTLGLARSSELNQLKLEPQELATLKAFSAKARIESFKLGRLAYRRASDALGFKAAALKNDLDGIPVWPSGLTGSISHTETVSICALAKRTQLRSLGTDIELKSRKISERALQRIALPEEIKWLEQAKIDPLFLFSAKESFFKLLYPLTRKFFWFHDARLSMISEKPETTFEAKLLKPLSPEFGIGTTVIVSAFALDEFIFTICAI